MRRSTWGATTASLARTPGRRARPRVGADPIRSTPRGGAGVVREVGLGRLEQGEHGPGLLGEALTARGEHGSAAAAVDQRHV